MTHGQPAAQWPGCTRCPQQLGSPSIACAIRPRAAGSGALRLEGHGPASSRLPFHPASSIAVAGGLLGAGCRRERHRGRARVARARCMEPPPPEPLQLPSAKRNLIYDDGPRKALPAALALRDVPCLVFLAWGIYFAVLNVSGASGLPVAAADYDAVLGTGVWLGLLCGIGGLLQAGVDEGLADDRPGMAKETVIVAFYALWNLSTVWLCARLGAGHGGLPGAPSAGTVLDPVFCFLCGAAFVFGAVGPTATLAHPDRGLSAVEVDRMRGLTACGLPGALYLVIAAAFAVGGGAWWERVGETWPSQRPCEQTSLLCGALAVEACMLLHRLGREGVVRFRKEAIPAGIAASVLLTLLPTAAQLYWHRSDISLWEFYFV